MGGDQTRMFFQLNGVWVFILIKSRLLEQLMIWWRVANSAITTNFPGSPHCVAQKNFLVVIRPSEPRRNKGKKKERGAPARDPGGECEWRLSSLFGAFFRHYEMVFAVFQRDSHKQSPQCSLSPLPASLGVIP